MYISRIQLNLRHKFGGIDMTHATSKLLKEQDLDFLLSAFASKLGLPLTIVDMGGNILAVSDTGLATAEGFQLKCWPRLVHKVTFQKPGAVQLLQCTAHFLFAARFVDAVGRDLALISGGFARPDIADLSATLACDCGSGQELPAQLDETEQNFARILSFIQGYWDSLAIQQVHQGGMQMIKVALSTSLDIQDVYQRVTEMAMHVPGTTLAALRVLDHQRQHAMLVSAKGDLPPQSYDQLPVLGLWGKCVEDGMMRFVANPAEDPGNSLSSLSYLSDKHLIYVPIAFQGRVEAMLFVGVESPTDFQSPYTGEFLRWIAQQAALHFRLHQAEQMTILERRKTLALFQLFEYFMTGPDIDALLAKAAGLIKAVFGLEWVHLRLETGDDIPLSPGHLHIPLEWAGHRLGLLSFKPNEAVSEPELNQLGQILAAMVYGLGSPSQAAVATEPASADCLSPRELEVIQQIVRGSRNKAIASALGISESTVKAHVTNTLRKLQAHDRTALAVWAAKAGIQ